MKDPLNARLRESGVEPSKLAPFNRLLWPGVLCVVVVTFLAGAASTNIPQSMEAEEFVLRSSDGAVRARLATDRRGNVIFQLCDKESEPAVSVGVSSDGRPAVAVMDPASDRHMTIAFNPLGQGAVTMYGNDGVTPRLRIGTSSNGTPKVEIRDASNKIVYEAP